jgi:hypothetical protein
MCLRMQKRVESNGWHEKIFLNLGIFMNINIHEYIKQYFNVFIENCQYYLHVKCLKTQLLSKKNNTLTFIFKLISFSACKKGWTSDLLNKGAESNDMLCLLPLLQYYWDLWNRHLFLSRNLRNLSTDIFL